MPQSGPASIKIGIMFINVSCGWLAVIRRARQMNRTSTVQQCNTPAPIREIHVHGRAGAGHGMFPSGAAVPRRVEVGKGREQRQTRTPCSLVPASKRRIRRYGTYS